MEKSQRERGKRFYKGRVFGVQAIIQFVEISESGGNVGLFVDDKGIGESSPEKKGKGSRKNEREYVIRGTTCPEHTNNYTANGLS